MKGKLNIFLGKTLLYAIPVCLLFEALFRFGFYPVVSNSSLFDYKMTEVQKQHLGTVKVLAIGSSCGLYDLNSPLIVKDLSPSYYNFCSWGLQVSDIQLLLPQLVDRYKPKYVILCSSPWDFKGPPNETYGNYTSMPSFFRDHLPELFYFRPFSSIHQLAFRKWQGYHPPVDHWGGSPSSVPRDKAAWDKYYLFPTTYTPGAYAGLDSLCSWLQDQKIALIFAEMPFNLVYDNAPEARQLLAEHIEKCRAIVTARGGYFFNYHDPETFPDSTFLDQTHLEAASAVIMTQKLTTDLKKIIK